MKKTMIVMIAGLALSAQANAMSFGIDVDCGIAGEYSMKVMEARENGDTMKEAFQRVGTELIKHPAVRKAIAHVYMDKSIKTAEQAKETGFNYCYANYE